MSERDGKIEVNDTYKGGNVVGRFDDITTDLIMRKLIIKGQPLTTERLSELTKYKISLVRETLEACEYAKRTEDNEWVVFISE